MNILFPYMARWRSANWGRFHQLLTSLCKKGHQVVVLESPPLECSDENGFFEVEISLPPGMIVREVSIPDFLSARWIPMKKLLWKGLLSLASARMIQDLIDRYEIEVLMLYNLPQYPMLRNVKCTTVFDMADDLVSMLRHETGPVLWPLVEPLARRMESKLINSCHLTTAASSSLVEMTQGRASLLPNGVSFDDLPTGRSDGLELEFPRPIIGFFGAFEYFVDYDLVFETAARMSDASFVLAGGGRELTRTRSKLRKTGLENVYLPGYQDYHTGLKYVSSFDICLIPFKQGPVAHSASPLKLFQYAALKKPIISTPILEVERLGRRFVSFASTPHGLAKAIEYLLNSPDEVRERTAWGYRLVKESHDWDTLADRFVDLISAKRGNNRTKEPPPLHFRRQPPRSSGSRSQ
ncbi:MAG: glycosyltransferase [Desulfomonilaceae bacterium]|nr:glycosyltransferase [Desulfomonilaceae bacterium]